MYRIVRIILLVTFSMPILSCGSDDPASDELVLTTGDYTGKWNSTTATAKFTNLSISARIKEVSAGKFEGALFISNNFTSCCNSGKDDGAIHFTVNGTTITDFVWDDIIPDCTGTFMGTGTITSNNGFRIEFTGTDCDGDHVGDLTLSK